MRIKKKDIKEREERPVNIRDTVYFPEYGRKNEILQGKVTCILETCEFRPDKDIRTNKVEVSLKNDKIDGGKYAQVHGKGYFGYKDFGQKVFKTEKEAEERLLKIEELEKQLKELKR